MPYTYQWPRPGLTVDTVIVARPQHNASAKLLLIKRKNPPCKGQWATPGGFVDENEPLDKAAARELQEETSVNPASVPLIQVATYGDPGRDPRGWCVTVAYAALVPDTDLGVKAADDAVDARWFELTKLHELQLAFDHKVIIRDCLHRLAEAPESRGSGELVEALESAAASLAGPWTPPIE